MRTTGIQSGPDASDKSRLVMTFIINSGVTWILCSFIVIVEVSPESSKSDFLENFSVTDFLLSDVEDSTLSYLFHGMQRRDEIMRQNVLKEIVFFCRQN